MKNLLYRYGIGASGGEEPLECAQKAVWGMLYAYNASKGSTSVERLGASLTGIVTVF